MRKHVYLPVFALVLGISGAIIRAVELSRAFEQDTGLQIPGETISTVMGIFAGVAVLLLAVAAFCLRGRLADGLKALSGEKSGVTRSLIFTAAILLFAAAGFQFAADQGMLPATRIIQILLAVFAAISMIVRIRKPGREYAIFSLVPIFWCCYWLILVYRDRSIDPVIADYVYEMFAVVVSALFFYGVAGYDFGLRKYRLNVFYGLASIVLCTITAFGPVFSKLFFGTDIAHPDMPLYFAACILFSLGGTMWFLGAVNPTPASQAADSPQTE